MHLRPVHDRVVVPTDLRRRSFALPHELIEDPSFSLAEKRAILAEWASDKSAVESYPALRRLPGTNFPVTFTAIMDAIRELDSLSEREAREESADMNRAARPFVRVDFQRARHPKAALAGVVQTQPRERYDALV